MTNDLIQYLETALWSSTDFSDGTDGEPLDNNYGIDDLDPKFIEQSKEDLCKFREMAGELLDDLDSEQVAHDFWLTRNRHGAGFWDGDYEKSVGDKLTEISHTFGEVNLYVGDDGKIYSNY